MKKPVPILLPRYRLFRLMSEIISLREQIAQAELAARQFGLASEQPPKQLDRTSSLLDRFN